MITKRFSNGEQIIQIMPVASINDENGVQRISSSDDDNFFYVVGVALTNKGKLYPIGWDGVIRFEVIDPAMRSFVRTVNHLFEVMEQCSDAYEAIKAYEEGTLDFDDAKMRVRWIADHREQKKAWEALYEVKTKLDRKNWPELEDDKEE